MARNSRRTVNSVQREEGGRAVGRYDDPDERNHRRSSAGLAKRRKRTGATISPVICNFFIAVSRHSPGERTCMREEDVGEGGGTSWKGSE